MRRGKTRGPGVAQFENVPAAVGERTRLACWVENLASLRSLQRHPRRNKLWREKVREGVAPSPTREAAACAPRICKPSHHARGAASTPGGKGVAARRTNETRRFGFSSFAL